MTSVTLPGMGKRLLSDQLWEAIEPMLPEEPPQEESEGATGRGCPRQGTALSGIIFVSKSTIPWEMLPQEMGCGSGVTCWRRLRDWQRAGVWERLHQALLDCLG